MSSISPMATKAFARRIDELGADYVDAPVSGGEVGAKAASLTIMCGGDPAVFEKVRPLLEKMGKNITLVGGIGDGQTTKVANQIIVALNIAAVGEALLFASRAGADPAKVRQALMGGFAASRILEVHGERMIKRTFNPGFRIRLHQKDLGLALQGARELGVSLPQTAERRPADAAPAPPTAWPTWITRRWSRRSSCWPATPWPRADRPASARAASKIGHSASSRDMDALVIHAPGDLRVEDVATPPVGPRPAPRARARRRHLRLRPALLPARRLRHRARSRSPWCSATRWRA